MKVKDQQIKKLKKRLKDKKDDGTATSSAPKKKKVSFSGEEFQSKLDEAKREGAESYREKTLLLQSAPAPATTLFDLPPEIR